MLRFAALLFVVSAAIASPQNWRDRTQQTHTYEHTPYQTGYVHNTHHKTQNYFEDRRAKVHQGPIDRDEVVVPQEYQDAHNAFSLDILKNQYYAQVVEKQGVVSISPFSLGHFLATIYEKTFDVPVETIPNIVRLNSQQISESYSLLNQAHKDDHKAYLSSQLYTSDKQIFLTPGQSKLGVRKQNVIFAETAPSLINAHVRVATRDILEEALVPNVPAFNKDTTRGVILNTLHYRNYFEHELLKVGRRPFQTPANNRAVDVETLETIGTYPVYENDQFAAVALPLESDGEDKHVVFVLPKTTLKQYLSSAALEYVFKSAPHTWVKKTVRVQVPYVNVTIAHNVDQYIKNENIVCSVNNAEKLNPIVQVTNLFIDDEEISYAVVTGAQVTGTKQSRQFSRNQYQRGSNIGQNFQKLNSVIPQVDNSLYSNELILNKPFFTYFYDRTYGPFGYTAISHAFTQETQTNTFARHHENPFDFSEETRNSRFTCEGQNH